MIRYSLLAFFLLVAVTAGQSNQAQHDLEHCRTPDPRYKRVQDFTVQWFQDNILETVLAKYTPQQRQSSAPFHNALFYTRNMTKTAIEYACTEGLITIWEPWPIAMYNSSTHPDNTYSCIHHNNNATRNSFFENMSEAFASKASGFVHVMHDPADYDKPPKNGIWARIELKALQRRVHVKKINRLSGTNKSSIQAIWEDVTGWVGDFYYTYCSDQPELKRRSRRRSTTAAQVRMDLDAEPTRKHCARLPVYTLHVDW